MPSFLTSFAKKIGFSLVDATKIGFTCPVLSRALNVFSCILFPIILIFFTKSESVLLANHALCFAESDFGSMAERTEPVKFFEAKFA